MQIKHRFMTHSSVTPKVVFINCFSPFRVHISKDAMNSFLSLANCFENGPKQVRKDVVRLKTRKERKQKAKDQISIKKNRIFWETSQ